MADRRKCRSVLTLWKRAQGLKIQSTKLSNAAFLSLLLSSFLAIGGKQFTTVWTQKYSVNTIQQGWGKRRAIELWFRPSNQTKFENSLRDTALNRTSLNHSLITCASLTSLCSPSKMVQTALNTSIHYKGSLNVEIKEGVNEKKYAIGGNHFKSFHTFWGLALN